MEETVIDTSAVVLRLKALGDEKRLRILLELAAGERCVCDLMDDIGTGQSLLSFHLRTLKDAGLVTDRKQGRWVHYSIKPDVLTELEAFLRALRETAEPPRRGPGCCE